MTVSELIARLNLPAQTVQAIQNIPMPENHAALKESFFAQTSLFEDFAEADPTGLTVLKLYLHWALDAKARYDALGIPETYFWDSMQDLPIWCDDYLTKYGAPGFKEWGWVGCSLRLNVIRIGRLQFQPNRLPQDVTLNATTYPADMPVLEIHIPAGKPLTPEDVAASLDNAPVFYKTYFGDRFTLFHCHSWLLSSGLKELLPAESRIMQFRNLFCVYGDDCEERQAEERVFGFLADDPEQYPASTSLQKALKSYLLSGKEMTMGAGIRVIMAET